jgi:hypothetical protein
VEKAISRTFLPALFDEDIADDDPRLKLACFPVKHAGLALPDPTTSAQSNYDASILMCSHLLAAFRGRDAFRTTDLAVIHGVKTELKSRHQEKYNSELNSIVTKLSCDDRRTILRGKETGQWLSTVPSTVNGTELYALASLTLYHRLLSQTRLICLYYYCQGCMGKRLSSL